MFIAVDPGKEKFGYAVFKEAKLEERGVLALSNIDDLEKVFKEAEKIVLGKGTGWKIFYKMAKEKGFEGKIVLVDEKNSTEEARKRFFLETRGSGLFWFLRKWLNLPGQPVDDIAAQIIGERFLKNRLYFIKNS
ncbi:hypothetical protein H5T87_05330 [bacterium]|nr:hypothetical protein [bacterium]